MSRRWVSNRVIRSALLAAIVALTSAATLAVAESYIAVTDVTLDPVAHTSRTSNGVVVVSGTIACSSDGEVSERLVLTLTQRGATGTDNLEFEGYICATEPSSFRVPLEYATPCPIGSRFPQCHFTAGPALLRATVDGVLLAEAQVLIRYV
jgi:hypothetical protein